MPRSAWVWFLGFGVWLFAGVANLRLRNTSHGELDLLVSAVFLGAGLFYRAQR